MNHTRAFVFFHAATRPPLTRILRLWLRKPSAGWLTFRRAWVQGWSGSDLFHVVIGDGEVILDPSHVGNRFYPQQAYAVAHPDICLGFEMLAGDLSLPEFEGAQPGATVCRILLKFLTRGRYQPNDCITTVKRALGNGGIRVPHHIYTPAQLKDWLFGTGCQYAILK